MFEDGNEPHRCKSNANGKKVELVSEAAIAAVEQDATVSAPPMLQACLGLQQMQQTRRYKLTENSLENAVIKITKLDERLRPKVPHMATSEKIKVLSAVLKIKKPKGYR
jgi:imidazoleglycerol phosphate synthase glutamine amidotransferase subunit HisH